MTFYQPDANLRSESNFFCVISVSLLPNKSMNKRFSLSARMARCFPQSALALSGLLFLSGVAAYAQVATPTLAPRSVGAYPVTQGITVSCATPEATLYYTTNGNDPALTDRTIVSGQTVTVNRPMTLKAKAFHTTLGESAVVEGSYGIFGQVAGGAQHSLALTTDGTVWAWGYNYHGQLGDGTTTQSAIPVPIAGLSSVIAIAAGDDHSVVLKSDGTVWAWGNNSQGRLGDGTTTQRSTAVQVSDLSGVVEIAAGSDFTVAMKGDGTVWAWGDNSYGQLGDNTTTRRLTPVQVSGLTTAVDIAAGSEHALAVKADGTVVAWGYNIRGQLGNNTTTNAKVPVAVSNISSVVRVEAGTRHSVAVKSDGTVWCWGMNSNGQLGDATTTDRKTPVQASGLTGVEAVTAGDNHTMAVTGGGAIWAWGLNGDGQLGLGSTTHQSTPQEVTALTGMVAVSGGATHSLAIKNDGTVWACGLNTRGQLGDATTTARTSPVQVHGPAAAPDSGWLHLISALLDSDGDGLPNWWELQYGFDPNDNGSINPNNGASGDPDGDGIDNITEYANLTDPMVAAGGGSGAGAGLRHDRWTITVPQSRYGMITDLTHTGALGRTPDQSADVTLAEAPISEGGEFGARLRGTVTAPVTGNYQFAVSGSHVAELWLGDSDSRYSKHRIAYVPNPVGSRDYTSYAGQQMSAPIALVAGHKYYIEALNVGSWNGDHLSVAWKIVGQESGALLSELEVIDTQYLTKPVSDPTDLDDDCLPDAWETANNLNAQDGGASNPDNGEYGDPDGDLLTNFEEYQLGTNPMQGTSITGRLQRQLWRDANVSLVREFRQNPRIVEIADIRDTTPGAEAPQSIPGNAAQRLRGWITAPVTGNYTLYIAGSRNCELWMGTNESKFSKVMVSQVIDRSGTEFHEWTRIAGQGSYPLSLVAGQRYYIEATQITRGWNDHMTLGWKRPDAGTDDPVEVVPAQFLSSFVKSAEDMEDDDLPDAWETQYGLNTTDNGSVSPDNGPLGDPDNDGVPNWMEYVAGTSPVNASTNGVTPDGTGMHGFLSRQIWNNIPTPLVAALTSSPQFVAAADVSDFVQMAESRYNAGPWFGERLRGRVIAPVSGEYTFWISGDNECELWLSPTASKFQRAKIAGAPKETWDITHFREWNKNPFQRSAPVTLVAGQEYYIEALHKQENDEDHLSVGWNLPGQNPDTDPPQVIPGSALRSYSPEADDLDDNGLADSWEQQFGINGMAYPDGGSYGDPDRDGVTNFEEYQIGSSPVVSGGFVGFLARQIWWDVGGVTAREFVQQPKFLQTADVWDLVESAEAPQDFGNNDGQRLRGWITAPDSGVYTFHIAGSGSSELWLGTGENKFSKTFIAQVVLPTDPHEWSKYSDQTSAPVTLVAGQRYYVELLAKEHNGNASRHLTLGWKRPGAGTEDPVEVVPSQYLTSFGRSDDDLDDDDMPDAWEAQFNLDTADNGSVNPDNGPFGDPDHDGVPNWLEYQAGTSPVNASTNAQTPDGGAAGVLSRQIWNSIPGATVSELTLSANFGGTPDTSDFVVSAESRYNAGGWFGERLRGRVIAPVSGEYTFWISGDNECELWLSPTASKFGRVKIAGAPKEASDITHFREWNKNPFQQSAPVTLVAGQEYYIEILHKQENDQDHVSVSWSYPGQDQQIIRGSALRSYVADADDVEDDGLPDSWERQVGLNPADNGFINPNEGSYGDPDADGFNNFAEYTNGTDPFSSQAIDTDGDGVSDYDEIHLYHTDPNSPDAMPPVKLADLALTTFQAPSGAWAMFPSGGLRSFTRRGAVDFPFSVNSAGIYLIEFKGAAYPANRYTPPVPIIARVDGVEVGRAEVLPTTSNNSGIGLKTVEMDSGRMVKH